MPVNVRLSPLVASFLLDATAVCAREQIELDDYDPLKDEMTSRQKERLRLIAETLVKSFQSTRPIAGVAIVGHADSWRDATARTKSPAERQKFEDDISLQRAVKAEKALRAELAKTPGGGPVLAFLNTKPVGVGSRELNVKNAKTDAAMRKNRRVVFKFTRCSTPQPIIHPPLEMPRPPGPDPDTDPNLVYAGNHFRIKMLGGTSAGLMGGVCAYSFRIWDVDNNRSADYEYGAIIATVGFPPITDTGEGSWSDVFTTPRHLQVDQFNAPTTHESLGAGPIGIMTLSIEQLFPSLVLPFKLGVPTGFSKGGGAESAIGGSLTVVRGSVRVSRGP